MDEERLHYASFPAKAGAKDQAALRVVPWLLHPQETADGRGTPGTQSVDFPPRPS